MAVFTITQAVLVNNIAYFEVPKGHEWQAGQTVTTANCTTATFNGTLTVLAGGAAAITPPTATSGTGTNFVWSGFSASITHANIAIEQEPATATVTDSN